MSKKTNTAPVRVLIVDNEIRVVELHKKLLTLWGYTPIVAEGIGTALVESAKQKAKDDRCQIALVDMRLADDFNEEDMSGLDLIEQIKPTETIIVSGYGTLRLALEIVQERGAVDFFEKDDDPNNLKNKIDKVAREILTAHYGQFLLFFKNAGFQISKYCETGFVCVSDQALWQKNSNIYVHLDLNQELGFRKFQQLSQAAKDAFTDSPNSPQIVFVIINKLPQVSVLHQVFALRSQSNLTVIPLSTSLILQAIRESQEKRLLLEKIHLFTGQVDHYDEHTEVSDLLSFFGRHSLLETIKHSLEVGESTIIFGIRKIGKSSLLARLRQDTNWVIASITTQGFVDGFTYMYVDIITSWQKQLQVTYPHLAYPNWSKKIRDIHPNERAQVFRDATKNFIATTLGEKDFQGLFIFIDEMDLLLDKNEYYRFSATLRSLAEDYEIKGRFALLMAGSEPHINRVDRISSGHNPFYLFFREKKVGPLSPDDTVTMINALGNPMGITYTDDAIQNLIRAGGGHPFLTRQLCSLAIKAMPRPVTISYEQTVQTITKYIDDPQNYLAETLWPIKFGGPPPLEAKLLKKIAAKKICSTDMLLFDEENNGSMFDQKLARQHLEEQSVIRKKERQDLWQITFQIFQDWIRKNILNLPV